MHKNYLNTLHAGNKRALATFVSKTRCKEKLSLFIKQDLNRNQKKIMGFESLLTEIKLVFALYNVILWSLQNSYIPPSSLM